MASQFTSRLRVVNVGYLNSVPYRYLQKLDWISYAESDPSECARRLHEGECDLALLPLAEYLVHGGYSALSYGIASQGPVDSVFLFSAQPIEELDLIAIDDSSQSSAMLLRLILAEDYPEAAQRIRLCRLSPDEAVQEIGGSRGALVIGDRAFKLRSRFPFQLDLAAHWLAKTSLPFVFAVWGGRPEVITPEIARELESQIEEGLKHTSIFARDWADQNRFDRTQAEKYVQANVFHRLSESALKGAEQFSTRAAQARLLPKSRLSLFAGSRPSLPLSPFHAPERHVRPKAEDVLGRLHEGLRLSVSDALALCESGSALDLALAASSRRHAQTARDERPGQASVEIDISGRGGSSSEEVLSQVNKISAGGDPGPLRISLAPGLNWDELIETIGALSRLYPGIPLRGLNAVLLHEVARTDGRPAEQLVRELASAGLAELGGDDVGLLVEQKRSPFAVLAVKEWLSTHRLCHRMGIKTHVEFPIRPEDSWNERLQHLLKLRQLQDETKGFVSIRCTGSGAQESGQESSRVEFLKGIALARLFLDNFALILSASDDPALSVIAEEFGASGA